MVYNQSVLRMRFMDAMKIPARHRSLVAQDSVADGKALLLELADHGAIVKPL